MAGMDDYDLSGQLERKRANPGGGLTGNIPFQSRYHVNDSMAGSDFYVRPAWMDQMGIRGYIADKYSFFGHQSAPGSNDVQNWFMNMQAGLGHNVQGPAEGGEWVYDAPKEIVRFGNNPNAAKAVQGKWSLLNGTQYDVLDANTGKVIGQRTFQGLKDSDNMDLIVAGLVGAGLGGMALTAAGGAGAAGAVGGGAEGAAAGAGVTGFGDAGAMYGGLDAASAASLGGGASVGGGAALGGSGALGAGAAGVTGFGDAGAMYGGLDAAGASSLGGGASVGGAAGGSTASGLGSLLKGAGMSGFSWTDLIGPALNLAGGAINANAAGKASDAQLQAAREAMALNEPFRQGGMKGLNRLLDLLGISGNTTAEGYGSAAKSFGADDFQADPGYAFRQSEQERALEHAAAARGLLGSGKYLKDAMRYSGDLASQEYGNAFNRFQSERAAKLNPLQSLMGAGQTSANTIADYRTQAGNAQAAGTVGQANALSNAIGQGYSMYANQQQQNQNNALLRSILGV